MKKILSLLLISFLVFEVFAGLVKEKEAKEVALNHYRQAILSFDKEAEINPEKINLTSIVSPQRYKGTYFYVFNVNKDMGFVIVSAVSSVKPVLAYSLVSGFNYGNISPGQQKFLDYFNASLEYAHKNELYPDTIVKKEWEHLRGLNLENTKDLETAGPLLGSIKWNQTWPYNAHLPADPNGPGGHVLVGCVATSMLQIMKYYNWPETGSGIVYHSSWANGGYDDYIIDFSEHIYNWSNIPAKASAKYNPDLAKINLHGSVAIKANWGPFVTVSQTCRVEYAFKNHFYYSENLNMIIRSEFETHEWKAVLRDQIDQNLPMVYRGYIIDPDTDQRLGGHLWNCDGYQGESYFHMNWGWGGAGDGFYTLDELIPSNTSGGELNNFRHGQQAIIDIFPEGEFPAYCESEKVINGNQGTFDDGSSINNYRADADCSFIIKPECGDIIEIKFNRFEVAPGDNIKIYDGTKFNGNLLAVYDNDNAPGQEALTVYDGKMTLEFKSNNSSTAKGWEVSYDTYYCKSNILYTQQEGSFGDGSGICNYDNYTLCSWRIVPEGANTIYINFKEFDLGDEADFVKVYKNSMSGVNTIGTYTKDNPPSGEISVDAGVAIIQFFSGPGETGKGWELDYYTDIVSIDKLITENDFYIYPNPGNERSLIFINSEKDKAAVVSMYSINGKQIFSEKVILTSGINFVDVGNLMTGRPEDGLYIIQVEDEENSFTQRFVFIH